MNKEEDNVMYDEIQKVALSYGPGGWINGTPITISTKIPEGFLVFISKLCEEFKLNRAEFLEEFFLDKLIQALTVESLRKMLKTEPAVLKRLNLFL